MAIKFKFGDPDFQNDIDLLVSARRKIDTDVNDRVYKILENIRSRGDEALLEYTERFDRLRLGSAANIKISKSKTV